VLDKSKDRLNQSGTDKIKDQQRIPQLKCCLGKNGITGEQRLNYLVG
jgi:hypothetical protein